MLLVFSTPPLPKVIPIAKNFRGGLFCPQESFHEGGDSVCPVLVLHFPQLKHAPVVARAPRTPGPCPLSREPLTSWDKVCFVSLAGFPAVPQAKIPLYCTRMHTYMRAHTCTLPPDRPEPPGESGHGRSAITKSICICLDGIFLWKYRALVGILNPSSLVIKHP